MKTAIVVLCVLCAAAAFGQAASASMYGGLTGPTGNVEFFSHPEHASQQGMAQEQNLLLNSQYLSANGERPLWEVAPVSHALPLGDMARMLKKEHEAVKKAKIIWEN